MNAASPTRAWIRIAIRMSSAVPVLLGLLMLALWVAGHPGLATGPDQIPMAPSTALLCCLFGLAIHATTRHPDHRGIHGAARGVILLGGLAVLVLGSLSASGIHLKAEHLGISVAGGHAGVPHGHISPLTAAAFILAALSYLTAPVGGGGRSRRGMASLALAVLLCGEALLLLLAYALGVPLLYGSAMIPPALLTGVALMALGMALTLRVLDRLAPFEDRPESEFREGLYYAGGFGLMACLTLAVSYAYFRNFEGEHRAVMERELAAIAELKVDTLVEYRKERFGDGQVLASLPGFSGLISQALQAGRGSRVQEGIQAWMDQMRAQRPYDYIHLVDDKGRVRMASPELEGEGGTEPDARLRPGIAEVLETGQIQFQDFYLGEQDPRAHLALLVPIRAAAPGRGMIGALVLQMDPRAFLYPFLSRWPVPSGSAETLLVRREGDRALFLNELRFARGAPLTLSVGLERGELPAVQAVLGREGLVVGRDYRGVSVHAALRRVPGSPWFLVARMDTAEVFAPMRARAWQLLAVDLVLLGAIASGMGFLWRQHRIRSLQSRLGVEEALRRAEAQYRCIFDLMPAPMTLQTRGGVLMDCNEAFCESTGFDREEALGRTTADLGLWMDAGQREGMREALRATGRMDHREIQLRRRDGQTRLMQLSARILPLDPEPMVLAVARDITERKQAEEALRLSEHKFRTLFESLTEGVALHELVMDEGGEAIDYRVLDVNPAYQLHTGLDGEASKGRLASELYGLVPPPYLQEYSGVALGGEALAFETYFPPLGKYFHISVISPNAGQFATVFEDITERRRREEELKQKNAEMERFTYMISHDLKSPLVTVRTFLEYLEQDMAQGRADRMAKDMDFIRGATSKMGRLLEDLLEVSRVGRVVNPPVQVALGDLLQGVLGAMAGPIATRGVEVQVRGPQVQLFGDRPRMEDVWQNLVENAVKYMGDQGRPRIELGLEPGCEPGCESVSEPGCESGCEPGPEAVFFIQDNGMGIDPRFHAKIFGLFEKLDPASEGTGLGLALVARIVELYGGRIWVESEGQGRGTRFRFTLPMAMNPRKEGTLP